MQNRDYYTFIEVLVALRNQYQKSQGLLMDMKKDIKITSNEYYDYNLILNSPSYVNNEPEIRLYVDKDYHSGVGPYMRHMLRNSAKAGMYWDLDHAVYILKYDNKYFFDKVHKEGQYDPKVIIPDCLQEDFDIHYQELNLLDICHLPEMNINSHPAISIDADGIYFTNFDSNYDISRIYYRAKDDNIYVYSHKKGKVWAMQYCDLFNTEIPCYKFSNEYLDFLAKSSSNSHITANVNIVDYIKKQGKFSINEKDNQVILSKVLSKR